MFLSIKWSVSPVRLDLLTAPGVLYDLVLLGPGLVKHVT